MEIIYGGRQTGKTTELVKLSSKNNIPIIVPTINERQHIINIAKDLELKIPQPLVYYKNIDISRHNSVYVDNIETLLSAILEVHISGITINNN